jgi:hypothetical protein
MLSPSDRKPREMSLQARSWDWGNSLSKISADVDIDSFEDLLDDIQDLSTSTDDKHKQLRSIYPPQEIYKSNLLIVSNSEPENENFINVLRTAYGADNSQTGVNTFRVNLVLKGLKVVHSYDFAEEGDYWRFLCGVRKGNRGNMENYVTGVCRVVGGHGEEDSANANKKVLGFNIGKLPKLTTSKDHHDGQGRFVINHNILTFRGLGPKGQLSDDEEIINLMDVWAIALTSDLTTTQSHSLLLQADLPEVLLKKGVNLMDYELQLANECIAFPFPEKLHNLPVTVFPMMNRPSLLAIAPTTALSAAHFFLRANQTQELSIKVVDTTHRVDIGQQSFVANGLCTEYKPHVDSSNGSSSLPPSSGGTQSPKFVRRSSGLSVVRFSSDNENNAARSSYDLNTPVSNRSSGKMTLTDPVIRLNTTQRIDTMLLSKGGERALKLEIKKASGLISVGGKIPAVYCTIYLAGKNGQRLTSNVAEMRTEPVKNLEPEWNHEIIIHDERLAKEEVEFVMVLLRDQSSGLLKHKHVGQVMIPLSCFLDTPAEFCLPIEPSYRMDNALSQTSYIGDIHLATHMVRGEAVNQKSQAGGAAGNKDATSQNKIFRVDSIRLTTFNTSVSFHRNTTGSTWWPMKLLLPSGSSLTSSTSSTTSTSTGAATSSRANLTVNVGGSTVITPTYFSGFLLSASEGLLLSISNPLDFHYLPVCPTNSTLVHLEVPWSDVLDVEVLSDSAVFISLQVSSQQQQDIPISGRNFADSLPNNVKGSHTGSPGDKKIVEFLIGPCPASKLVPLILRRKRFQELGQNFAAIQLFKGGTSTPVGPAGGPNSPLSLRSRTSSGSRAGFFAAAAGNSGSTRLAGNIAGTYGIVETIRETAEIIEALFKDLNLLSMDNPECQLSEKDIRLEQTFLRSVDLYLRCKLVPLLLPHIPDSEELPEFSISYIQKAVEKDKGFYQMLIPLRVNEKMESLNERYDSFMEEVARRIRDFVIFSSRAMNDGAGPQYSTHGTLIEPCEEEDLPKDARFCIEVLTEKYHEVLKQSLRPYVQSKQTFQAIQGQWLKNCVLKLLIEKNHQYDTVIATALRVNGLYLLQGKRFALIDNIDEVLDWFASTLLQDTRLWLSKTIDQARNKRENPYELPWDTELVGDRICSHLPESISFQLKVFMDVCVKDFSKSGRIVNAMALTEAAKASSSTSASAVSRSTFGDQDQGALENAKFDFYKIANERLLQAIAQAWILLSNEYERSLLSKHWDQVKPKAEQDAYVDFLCAIANDCYRIRRDQIMALSEIRARDDRKQEILGNLHTMFRNLQTQAVSFVMRIVYSTVQRTLIDFEDIWLNPTDEQHSSSTSYATRALLSNTRTWMLRMKDKLEYKVYRELLPNCVEVIVLRFFILFREILAQKNGPPLRNEDIQKLKVDIEIMSSMLEDICEHDGDSSYDGLETTARDFKSNNTNGNGYWVQNINKDNDSSARPLGPKLIEDCVKDVLLFFHSMVMLLSEPIISTQFTASMTWMLQDYENIYHANHPPYFVEFLLVHCILPLRPQSANETDTFLAAYHQQALLVPPRVGSETSAPAPDSNIIGESGKRKPRRNLDQHDLYWRIFGNNKLFEVIAESYEAAGGVSVFGNNSSNSNSNNGGHAFKFLAPSLGTKRQGVAAAGASTHATATASAPGATGAGLMRFRSILPVPKAPTGDLFKPLREKAADLRVFHNQRRQNEEIMAILRLLGLGGQSAEDEHSGNDSTSGKTRLTKSASLSESSDQLSELPATKDSAARTIINLVASVTGSSSHIVPVNAHGTTYNGFIKISHIEVRKLHSAALFGECHPYIYFTLGLQRQKTSVKPNCHGATWDEVLALKVPTALDLTTATLSVEVFDKEFIRRKRLLGEVAIKLDGLDMREFDSWFALEGGECAGVGEIHVKISLQRLNS